MYKDLDIKNVFAACLLAILSILDRWHGKCQRTQDNKTDEHKKHGVDIYESTNVRESPAKDLRRV